MKKMFFLAGCAIAAFGLAGCDFWGKSVATKETGAKGGKAGVNDPVLVKIDGKPVLYKAEFLEFADQAMKANPYLASFGITSYESAPEPIRQQLLEAMVQQKLIALWGQSEGVERTVEYKEAYAKLVDQLKLALVAQTFEKQIMENIQATDAEVAAKYEESRSHMVKDPGSVKAVGVSFTSEEKAKVFYDLVANKEEDSLANLAKESGAKVVEFGTLSLDMRQPAENVPAAVRRALAGLGEKQYYVQARDGETFWVVQVTDRVKPTYMTLEEVREQLSSVVKQEKFRARREDRINQIRSKHTVDIDNAVLGGGEDPLAALQKMFAAQGGELSPEFLQQLEEAGAAEEAEGDTQKPLTATV